MKRRSRYLISNKAIYISEPVYEKLKALKGKRTFDQLLREMLKVYLEYKKEGEGIG